MPFADQAPVNNSHSIDALALVVVLIAGSTGRSSAGAKKRTFRPTKLMKEKRCATLLKLLD